MQADAGGAVLLAVVVVALTPEVCDLICVTFRPTPPFDSLIRFTSTLIIDLGLAHVHGISRPGTQSRDEPGSSSLFTLVLICS